MDRVEARILKGFRDHLPVANMQRQRMLSQVAQVFESFGFGPLTTPALEYTDVLLGNYGDEGNKLLYRFEDNGGRDVALRYDLTVPLARVVAQHRNLEIPFRRYQIAPCWRAEKPAPGRYREFLQCDVDIVGEASLRADAECIAVGLEVLRVLGVTDATLRVNNRCVLDGLLDLLEVEGVKRRLGVMRSVDKLPKIGRDGVSAELSREVGMSTEKQEILFDFLAQEVKTSQDVAALRPRFSASPSGQRGVDRLVELLELLDEAGCSEQVEVDLSIARGLAYYTGTIYETFVAGRESFGSVMSGGRYDNLLGTFLKESLPAVGISLGIDRLLAVLADAGTLEEHSAVGDIFLALFDRDGYGWIQTAARRLRAEGIRVEVSLREGKLGKQLRYAERKGYRWVALAGPDERAQGQLSLKDLVSGEQTRVTPENLVELLRGT